MVRIRVSNRGSRIRRGRIRSRSVSSRPSTIRKITRSSPKSRLARRAPSTQYYRDLPDYKGRNRTTLIVGSINDRKAFHIDRVRRPKRSPITTRQRIIKQLGNRWKAGKMSFKQFLGASRKILKTKTYSRRNQARSFGKGGYRR